jgi:hypothetical protein
MSGPDGMAELLGASVEAFVIHPYYTHRLYYDTRYYGHGGSIISVSIHIGHND